MRTHKNIPRINPRRPTHIKPSGVPRIILGEINSIDDVATLHRAHSYETDSIKPQRSLAVFTRSILVATVAERGHLSDHVREVLAAAAILACSETEVILAVLGKCSDEVGYLGVDKLLNDATFDSSSWQPVAMIEWLAACIAQCTPSQIFMADNSIDGDWARRYAARYDIPCCTRIVQLTTDQARIRANAQHDRMVTQPTLMVLERQVAVTELPFIGRNVTEAAPIYTSASVTGVQDNGIHLGDAQTLPLEEADFIVSAGKGMTDLALFNELALAMGATTAASRVAVDDGLFPRSHQVGATGKTVQASTYIALGISGAAQHLQGIKDCRHVIAVNLDEAAPIARRANLMVIADTQEWMWALLKEVRARKRGTA